MKNFIVVWSNEKWHESMEREVRNIQERVISPTGTPVFAEFDVMTPDLVNLDYASVILENRLPLVTWQSFDKEQNWHIWAQRYLAGSTVFGAPFKITDTPQEVPSWNIDPQIETNGDGKYNVVWTHYDPRSAKTEIVYRQF
jgi:hypothetical protein